MKMDTLDELAATEEMTLPGPIRYQCESCHRRIEPGEDFAPEDFTIWNDPHSVWAKFLPHVETHGARFRMPFTVRCAACYRAATRRILIATPIVAGACVIGLYLLSWDGVGAHHASSPSRIVVTLAVMTAGLLGYVLMRAFLRVRRQAHLPVLGEPHCWLCDKDLELGEDYYGSAFHKVCAGCRRNAREKLVGSHIILAVAVVGLGAALSRGSIDALWSAGAPFMVGAVWGTLLLLRFFLMRKKLAHVRSLTLHDFHLHP